MPGKSLHVKKGDTVMVVTGKDKNKTGKILQILPKKEGVLVEGLNVVKGSAYLKTGKKLVSA